MKTSDDPGQPAFAKKYWYITYYAAGHTGFLHVNAYYGTSPAQWSIEASKEFDDGPYVVVFAQEITEAQFNYVAGYMS